MRKVLCILVIPLLVLASCQIESDNVNKLIYPYLNFSLNSDGTAAVSIADGAALGEVEIPAIVVLEGEDRPVSIFLGHEDRSDAAALQKLTIPADTTIAEGVLDGASALEELILSDIGEDSVWPELPDSMSQPGQHFIGWYAGDDQVHGGDPIDPDHPVAEARFEDHVLSFVPGKDATCTEPGSADHYSCTCGNIFADPDGLIETTKEELSIPALGHDSSGEWQSNESSHWKICARCHVRIEEAQHSFSDWQETGDDIWTRECTVCHWQESQEHLEHTLTHHKAVDATCTERGNIEYWKCDVCKQLFTDEDATNVTTQDAVTIPALGHRPGEGYQHDGDNHWQECTRCEDKIEESVERHDYELTYSFESGILTVGSRCHVCGYETTDSGTSETGAFDISTTEGLSAHRDSEGRWVISLDEEEQARCADWYWSGNGDGKVCARKAKSIKVDCTVKECIILCHLLDEDGREIDVCFAAIHR